MGGPVGLNQSQLLADGSFGNNGGLPMLSRG